YYWDSQTGDFALKLHGGRIDADAWFENWYLKNIKPEDIKAVKEGYVSKLTKLMKHPQRGERTTEELYGEIVKLRKRLFGSNVVDEYNSQIIERLKKEGRILADFFDKNIKRFSEKRKILAAIFTEFKPDIVRSVIEGRESPRIELKKLKDWLKYDMPIDDVAKLIRALKEPTHYVHVTGSVNSLAADLKVFGEWLLERWGSEGKVTFVVKEKRFTDEATKADIDALLELDEFKTLRANERFNIVISGSNSPGFNLNSINEKTKALLRKAQEGRAVFGFKGEVNNHTINRIGINHFRLFLSREIETKRTTGIFWDENEYEAPTPVVLELPAWIPVSDRWGKAITTIQFYRAKKEFIKRHGNFNEAARRMQQEGGTFVENVYPQALLLPLEYKGDLRDEYRIADKKKFPTLLSYARGKRQQLLDERAEEVMGEGNYVSDIYVFKEGPKEGKDAVDINDIAEHSEVFVAGKENVLVKGGFLDLNKWSFEAGKAEAERRPYSGENRTLISHDSIRRLDPSMRFSFNLLYFFTPNLLIDVYNRYRRDEGRFAELMTDVNFYLDAHKPAQRDKDKASQEVIPVYNKGYVGMTEEGAIVFGRRRLLGGALKVKIGGKEKAVLSWGEEDVYSDINLPNFQDEEQTLVKSEAEGRDIVIYTPMISKIDYEAFDSKYNNGAKVYVGKGRVNLVVYNNKINCIVEGDVMMPSMGVVISLSKEKFSQLLGELTERSDNQNNGEERVAYVWKQAPGLEWTFEWPKDSPKLKWYYGGGALLVKDGNNLVKDQFAERENFVKEGWFNLLSMQTQENPVQSWKRVPKMVMGVTDKNRFFAVSFSGRSAVYKGANFAEAIDIIEKHLQRGEKIKDAFNLDGGSSVSFNVVDNDGILLTTSWPCIGPDNSEGIRRPISSYAYLKPKAEAKSSSSGVFEEGKEAIFAAQDILLKAIPTELHPARIEQTKDKLDELYADVMKLTPDELKGDERSTLLYMIAAQKQLLLEIETAYQAATLGRDARVILDLSIIPPSQQKEVRRRIEAVQRILKTAVPDKAKDTQKADTGVVLLQGLGGNPQFSQNDIIISDRKIANGVKHFIIDKGMTEDNALYVTPYLIAYARGLVSINNENYNTLIGRLDGLYRMIAKATMPEALREMLKNPDWTIANIIVAMIPDVEAYGQEYVERLQRQAWAVLVAA
ncbi:MAG: phosphodiester glycosidase family protein, partial [Candidatus Omnitrophota bacterium]